MLPYVGLLHAVVVVALFILALRRSGLDGITKLNVVVVAVWTNLVLTALVLSVFSRLNVPLLYAGVSILLAIPLMGLLAQLGRPALATPEPIPSILDRDGLLSRGLVSFMLVTGVLVLAANILIAIGYVPNNADTVSYRLPRIYFYWTAGSLAHFASGIDPRVIYYPFDGTLLQMPIVQYRWSAVLFNAAPLAAWCIIGATAFRIAREVGFSRRAGLAAAWLVCLTPGVLVQATSGNDEIIAAFVLLIGVHFAIRFWRGERIADAAFALLAARLSVGTQLHIAFFWPMVLAGMALVGFRVATGRPFVGRSLFRPKPALRLAPVAFVCAMLVLPFAWANWRASGEALLPSEFASHVVNRPFRLDVGAQNFALHAAQTALSPVPDLDPSPNDDARRAFYAAFNDWFSPLFKWVNQGADFMSAGYRFNGPTGSTAWFRNENSVDLGFSYLLILASLAVCIRRRGAYRVGLVAAGGFVVWFTTYCLTAKFIEGFSVYLTYVFIVCAPAVAFALARPRSRAGSAILASLLAFVTATHALAAWNILRFNTSRNVPSVLAAQTWPINPRPLDESVAQAIRQHGGAHFLHTHWEIPYWSIMAVDKAGRYEVDHPSRPKPDRLNIFTFQKVAAYGSVPIRVPDKPSPGLALLGSFTTDYGPEWIFASGAGVDHDLRYPNGYIVLPVNEETKFGQTTARDYKVSPEVAGLDPKDGLQFRYTLRGVNGAETVTDWGGPERSLAKPDEEKGATLIVEVRRADRPDGVTRVDYPLGASEPFKLDPPPVSAALSHMPAKLPWP